MKKLILIFYSLIFISLVSCNEKAEKKIIAIENETSNQKEIDSIEITKLIRQVYEWHNTISIDDFPYKFNEEQDSIFVGIDWDKYQKNIELFKQTNYFTNEFLNKHKEIAKTLDSSIKKADIIYRNNKDGMSLWETGADNWCGCQDYDEKYWETITIDKLNINKSEANFNWSLDKYNSHSYKITAKVENGQWRINKLEGFKHFYSIEEYDKMMKN